MEIKTFLRIRPLQVANKSLYAISDDKKTLTIKENAGNGAQPTAQKRRSSLSLDGPPVDQEFKFDSIYNMDSTQIEVYKTSVQPLVDEAINRSQAVGIVAYGENQSGKSYSIFGIENIQQEEFSIDQEDPKDTRGVVLKAMHYIFKKAKSEGKAVTLDCQMLDLYLDTLRDLSKGKTNKFNKQSIGNLVFEREKEVEIEETVSGDVKLNNIQTVKISNPKEAANFIEKCLDYQKKLENDNGQLRSFAHTFFIMNLTYGKEIHSQIYFVDLGSSEKKTGKKQKEGFIVAGGLQTFQKLLQQLQNKLTDDEKEVLQVKDSKLTYLLKNLYKDYSKMNMIFHLSINESNLESCLKTLEISDRIKNYSGKSSTPGLDNADPNGSQGGDNQEMTLDQLIQQLNKENFDLRNSIETLKRSHKIKLEELQQLLFIPCEIEYLLKNKDQAPEMALIHEQRKAMEKADSFIKANKDLEKRLDYLTSDLQELKKDKKIQQETFSQKFIVLNGQLEQLREDKASHQMTLHNQLRMNKAYSAIELKQVGTNGAQMVRAAINLSTKLQKNELFRSDVDNDKITYEMDDIKQHVKVESVVKYQRLFNLQLKAQEKEKVRMQEQYESQIKTKQDQIQKLVQTYQKYKAKKDLEIKQSGEELQRLHEVFIKQDQIIQGLIRGDFSGGNNQARIPENDLIPLPTKDKFPKLYSVLDTNKDKAFSQRKSRQSSPQRTMKSSSIFKHQKAGSMQSSIRPPLDLQQTIQSTMNAQRVTIEGTPQFNEDLVSQNLADMEYNQLKQYVLQIQNEIKRVKQNPLNPDDIRSEKIKELKEERERYKDLYVSESIKNKEFMNPTESIDTRNIHSSATASRRPMTTVSSGSTMRGGFFVTQLGGGQSRPMSRVNQSSFRRNIMIKQ